MPFPPKNKHAHNQGNGTLYRRKRDGKPYGAWIARFMVDGNRFDRSTGTENRREAEARLAELSTDVVRGKVVETLENLTNRLGGERQALAAAIDAKPALALADAWDAFMGSIRRKETSATTNRINKCRFAAFVDWMAENHPAATEMRHVDAKMAEEYMKSIRAGVSGKTFNDRLCVLRHVWKVMTEEARIKENPWEGIQAMAHKRTPRRELTTEELRAIITPLEGEMRTLFAIGIYTGLRLGDCVKLDWGAVDLVRGFIDLTPSKTAKHGTMVRIAIAEPLRALLKATPPAERRGVVLPNLHKKFTEHEHYFYVMVQKVFTRSGIATQQKNEGTGRNASVVGFHSLRHTFISFAGNAGIPLAVVQSIVGHTSKQMTAKYFHTSDSALRGVANAMPNVLAPAKDLKPMKRIVEAPVDAEAVEATETRLEALRALLAQMDAEELNQAVEAAKEAAAAAAANK